MAKFSLAMEQSQEKRPTLRSLAEITGLGISTVSQALRDSPEISEDTRKRVRLAAQQVGYRPNRAGVRLRTGKSNVITVVLNPQDGGSGFFANMIFGISDALANTAYHLVVTPYSLSDPMAPIRYIVETNSADGVIISRTQADDPRVRYMTENNMPFATHGRTDMDVEHCYFDFDNEGFAFEAVRRLKQRGRGKLAIITPPPTLNYYGHTLRGFERGLLEFNAVGFAVTGVNSDSDVTDLRQAGLALTQREEPPDGIVCSSYTAALAIMSGMRDGGHRIGQNFDIVAKPNNELFDLVSSEIIGVTEDFRRAGSELAKMLIARIDGANPKDLQKIDLLADYPT
jgi:LacI family transcriptional regulator